MNAANSIIAWINTISEFFWQHSLHMLIQSSALIVTLFIIDLLIRKKTRAIFRYALWMLVLLKLLFPASLTSPVSVGALVGDHFTNVPTALNSEPAFTSVKDAQGKLPSSTDPQGQPDQAASFPELHLQTSETDNLLALSWKGLIFLTWLAGAFILVLLLLQRWSFARGLIRQADEADEEIHRIVAECCESIGINEQQVAVKISPNMVSPSVFGILRPVIILPSFLMQEISEDRLRTILIHEAAHIRRHDLLINMIQNILQILYFYNPLLWFANSLIRRIREEAVDEIVLVSLGDNADNYSHALLDVAEIAFQRPALGLRLIGILDTKTILSYRIKHIISRPIPTSARLGIAGLAFVMIFALFFLPMAEGQKNSEDSDRSQNRSIASEPAEIVAVKPSENGKTQAAVSILMIELESSAVPAIEKALGVDLDSATGRVILDRTQKSRIASALSKERSAIVVANGSTLTELSRESTVKSTRQMPINNNDVRELGCTLAFLPESLPSLPESTVKVHFALTISDLLGYQEEKADNAPILTHNILNASIILDSGYSVMLRGSRRAMKDVDFVKYASGTRSAGRRHMNLDYFLFLSVNTSANTNEKKEGKISQVATVCRFFELDPSLQIKLGPNAESGPTTLSSSAFKALLGDIHRSKHSSVISTKPLLSINQSEGEARWVREMIHEKNRDKTIEFGDHLAALATIADGEKLINLAIDFSHTFHAAARGRQASSAPGRVSLQSNFQLKPGQTVIMPVSSGMHRKLIDKNNRCYAAVTSRIIGSN